MEKFWILDVAVPVDAGREKTQKVAKYKELCIAIEGYCQKQGKNYTYSIGWFRCYTKKLGKTA